MRRLILMLFACLLVAPVTPPPTLDAMQPVIQATAEDGRVCRQFIPFNKRASKQFERYLTLQKSLSADHWMQLTRHDSSVIRVYALLALLNRETTDVWPLLIQYLQDDASVDTQDEHRIRRKQVSGLAMQYTRLHLTADEMVQFDRHLVMQDVSQKITKAALRRLVPNADIHSHLTRLSRGGPYAADALIPLAKLSDISQLDNELSDRLITDAARWPLYEAIEARPDPRFFSRLSRHLQSEGRQLGAWVSLYRAIAAYRSPAAAQILAKEWSRLEQGEFSYYCVRALVRALYRHRTKVFDDLLFETWVSTESVQPDTLHYLHQQHPDRTLAQIKVQLSRLDTFLARTQYYETITGDDSAHATVVSMLRILWRHDPDAGRLAFKHGIDTGDGQWVEVALQDSEWLQDANIFAKILADLKTSDHSMLLRAYLYAIRRIENVDLQKQAKRAAHQNRFLMQDELLKQYVGMLP